MLWHIEVVSNLTDRPKRVRRLVQLQGSR
jgi:hypothetical protein